MSASTNFVSAPWTTTAFNQSTSGPPFCFPKDQSKCYSFQKPTHIGHLSDNQVASLELAFSESNFGEYITIAKNQNSSDKLTEIARRINRKLEDDCPTGIKLNVFSLYSADSSRSAYRSQSNAITGTITVPVLPEQLSYVDKGQMSCLFIDIRAGNGKLFRIDILNVNHALESEYAKRAEIKFVGNLQDLKIH